MSGASNRRSEPYFSDPDVTLWQGDALELLRELPDGAANGCVTSPPYLDARPEYPSPSLPHFEDIFRELGRVVAGPILFNVGRIWRNGSESLWWHALLERADWAGLSLLDTLIWIKPNANPIRGRFFADSHEYVFVLGGDASEMCVDELRTPYAESSVARLKRGWTNHIGVKNVHSDRERSQDELHPDGARPRSFMVVPVGREKGNEHPAPMALDLAVMLVRGACEPGGTVLDPFAGSGTTLYAARLSGRRALGIELSEDYCEMANVRMGQQSLLVPA